MASPFDDEPGEFPFEFEPSETELPSVHRRHLEQLGPGRRTNRVVMLLAVGLPMLASIAVLIGFAAMFFGDSIGLKLPSGRPGKVAPQKLNATEWQNQRELQQQRILEREEEELRQIRERVDRAVEARQREAERAVQQKADREAAKQAELETAKNVEGEAAKKPELDAAKKVDVKSTETSD